MKLTARIKTLVTNIIARDIAAGVELARSLGHGVPKDFAIGVRFLEDTHDRTRICMRLDDATHDSIVQLPHLDGRLSLKTVAALWKQAWVRLHADALTLAQVWLDKHPEAATRQGDAAVRFLDALQTDEALLSKWMDACAERAKHFTYTPEPGARLVDALRDD